MRSIRNKDNWNDASTHLLGSYSHPGMPGFPFRLFCSQEQKSRNIFIPEYILIPEDPKRTRPKQPKKVPDVYSIYWPPCWRTKEVLQHGDPILGSVILCGTFRRISQLWENAHTLNLGNCLLYLSFTISQFFDFIQCTVFDFIFYCVTVHTLYITF